MNSQLKLQYKILHLEDDNDYTEAFSKGLEDAAGYNFIFVAVRSVDDALKVVEEGGQFDLILVDLKLPGALTGLDFLKILQETGRLKNVRKIIISDLSVGNLSISGRKISYQELDQLGMSKFLSKEILWNSRSTQQLVNHLIDDYEDGQETAVAVFKSFVYLSIFSIALMTLGMALKSYSILLLGSGGFLLASILLVFSMRIPVTSYE